MCDEVVEAGCDLETMVGAADTKTRREDMVLCERI